MEDLAAKVWVTVRGEVPEAGAEYALGMIRHVVSRAPDRIEHVHVVLAIAANPAQERPAGVAVEAAVAGRAVHVHAAAAGLKEAIDEAADRLRRQLTDLRERPLSRRRTARPSPAPVAGAPGEADRGAVVDDQSDQSDRADRPD